MLRSRLFWKLFLTFAVVNLLAAGGLLWLTLQAMEEGAYRQAEVQLAATVAMMDRAYGDRLTDSPSAELQEDLRAVGQRSRFRLTLIGLDGMVLADSAQADLAAVQAMENHASRVEVATALLRGKGAARRTSATLLEPFVYLAEAHDGPDGPTGVLRAAVPVASIRAQMDRVRSQLWGLAALVGAALLAATYLVVVQVVRPVLRLNSAADAIAGGDYSQRAYVPARDELGRLAAAFNRMSGVLDRQFAQLRDAKQRHSTVLEGMVEGVLAIDPQQQIVLANQAAARLLNLDGAKLEGRQLIEAIRNHQLLAAVTEVLDTGKPQNLDVEWRGAESLALSVQVTPLPGEPAEGAIVVMHNITELRRLETLRQEFVANVSHELKTPLSSIKAYTETLIDGALHDEHHAMQFLGHIDEQTDRLTALIQDMLRLARIESEEETFEVTSVLVSEAAAACLQDYSARAEARQIALSVESEEPQLQVMADPEGLRVILNNLVDNAIKYTPDAGRVTLSWRRAALHQVQVEVSDTGIGIPAESLPRVFERFHRVDKARSREMGGTGLGLSIVKHLAQAFGGGVAVESSLNQGSRFSVTLPEGASGPEAGG